MKHEDAITTACVYILTSNCQDLVVHSLYYKAIRVLVSVRDYKESVNALQVPGVPSRSISPTHVSGNTKSLQYVMESWRELSWMGISPCVVLPIQGTYIG